MRSHGDPTLPCGPLAYAPLRAAGSPLLVLRRLVPFLLSLLTACHAGPRSFLEVESGRLHLDAAEAEALRGLLAAAGLAPRQLGIDGELGSDQPNWIEIDDQGHVWALGLGAAPNLDSLAPLADLPRLSIVRVRGANLTSLEDLACAESLTGLTVVDSGLSSLAGLDGCRALQVLDLRGNQIESLDELAPLPALRILDLADNAISDVVGLAGRQSLESLDLSGNDLWSSFGLEQMPRLERLNLARNRVADLDGLLDLPRLRELLVDDNHLFDASGVDRLPALELVNLNGNHLERFPRLVERLPEHLWRDNPGPRRARAAAAAGD